VKSAGFSLCVSEAVEHTCHRAGLQGILRDEFTTLAALHLYTEAQIWFDSLLQALVSVVLVRTVSAPDEAVAREMTSSIMGDVRASSAEGLVPDMRFARVVARQLT
jgi:hypothetical protein